MVILPSCAGVPPSVCLVAVLNGGVQCVLRCPPCLDWVWRLALSVPLVSSRSSFASPHPSACLLSQHCGMAVVVCGMAVGDEGVCSRCLYSLFLFLFVLVFGVVRAQPCEHARYPRTPSCFLVVLSSFCARLSSLLAFLLVEWRGLPCVRVCGRHDSNR